MNSKLLQQRGELSEPGGSCFQILSDTQAVSSIALACTLPEALMTKDTERLRHSMPFLPQSLLIISLQESQAPKTSREVCKKTYPL